MSKYYYHGFDDIQTGIEILKSGGIKSRRLLGKENVVGFNRLDYISLCDKGEQDIYEDDPDCAYLWYIQDQFCFIISDTISVIHPSYVPEDIIYGPFIKPFLDSHSEKQYTNLFDEVQVRDEIPLSKIIGIGIPFADYEQGLPPEIEEFILLSRVLGFDVVDTSDEDFVEKYESRKERREKRYE